MISAYGRWAGTAGDDLEAVQAQIAKESAKANPDGGKLQRLRAKALQLAILARRDDEIALQTFAQRTGLDQALAVYGPQAPVVTTRVVQEPTSWWPVAVGAVVAGALALALG